MRSRLRDRDRERERERDGERLLESSLDAALTFAGVRSEGSLPGGGGRDWRLSSGAGFLAASAARSASFVDGASAAGAGAAAAGAAGAGAAAGTNVGADGAGAGALIVESLPIVWASAVRGALQRLHSVRHWKLWLPQLAQSQSPGTYAAAPPATGPDGAAEITKFPPGGAAAPGGKARGVKAGAAPAL